MITEVSNVLYQFQDERSDFGVHILEDRIFVFGNECQMLENPSRAEASRLHIVFPNVERIKASAQMYTEGVIDKEKFTQEIKRLNANKTLLETDFYKLMIFKDNLKDDAAVDSVTKQLILLGFDQIFDINKFGQEHPALQRTCEGFYRFVCESRQFFKNKPQSQNPS